MSINGYRRYSVLSPDGRWRLYQDWGGVPSLFDLNKDPISSMNVATDYPGVVKNLHDAFDQWETTVSRIRLQMPQRDSEGHGVLIGDELQRAATLSDATVAIGLTPTKKAAGEQIIIEQQAMLRITQDAVGLHIRFHGLNADLPPLPSNQCSSLVMTGTLNRKIELTDFGNSTLNIYIDGNPVKRVQRNIPLLDSTDIHRATYIGMSEDGSHRFDGKLSEPIYLNRRIDYNAPPALTVEALSKQVCASYHK
jgi:hypothetical protein